jgi:hypothetical protein
MHHVHPCLAHLLSFDCRLQKSNLSEVAHSNIARSSGKQGLTLLEFVQLVSNR